ncbi:MAG: NAD(P)/FAD-dependent oxidoreductase [Nitriliruptorales bacterium]
MAGQEERRPRIVIVGAGFAGLRAARGLADEAVDVTIVDRRNHHTFQPLLYQVATAGLHPQDVGRSVRTTFRGRDNVRFRLGEVTAVDWEARKVRLADGAAVAFDQLVIGVGVVTNDYGVLGVEQHAFPLKGLADAVELRDHVLRQFEEADADPGLADDGALTFVIAGGGPTGVELAGALLELIAVLRGDYPSLAVERARVVLVDPLDGVLTGFSGASRAYALDTLRTRGVEVRLGTAIAEVGQDRVVLDDGGTIRTRTVIWAAGVRPHPLAATLGVPTTPQGRIAVDPDLRIVGRPEAFAVGDLAAAHGPDGRPLPQLAPVAIQEGRHAARQILRLVAGKPTEPLHCKDRGTMATIGRNAAVAELWGGVRLRGFLAWIAWLGLHLLYLVGFRNRLSVLLSWAWSYVTYDRGARLLFHEHGVTRRTAEGERVAWYG